MTTQLNWLGLSRQKAIVSIVHDGKLYVNGREFTRQYPPGALDLLLQHIGERPPAIIAVNEEEQELYGDRLIDALERQGWTFLNVRPSGPNLSLWFGEGKLPTFDEIVGATNAGGTEPKDNGKRNGVMSALNSPLQGAFISGLPSRLTDVTLPDGTDAKCLNITLPDRSIVRALAIPDNPDATDGDMLIHMSAVHNIAKNSGMSLSASRLLDLDAVQLLTLGNDAGLKAMGQHSGRVAWPPRFEGYDIVVGRPGLLTKTQREITAGKITLLMEEDPLGYVAVDGLESTINVWMLFFRAADMTKTQRLVLVKDIYRRQLRALNEEQPRSDWRRDETERDQDKVIMNRVWQQERDDKRSMGQIARHVSGSPFAHPQATGADPNRPLRIVQSAIEKGQTEPIRDDRDRKQQNRQHPKGLPYVVLPGFNLKRAYHEFAGVPEPEFGAATILWRPSGTPYAFVLNSQQYADPDEYIRHNGADGDDHWNAAVGIRYDGLPFLVLGRPPNSPDNGNAYLISHHDLERWKRVAPVMPLKAQWHAIQHPSQVQSKLDMGPELTPPAPTRDLDTKMQVARFANKMSKYIGKFANMVQALHSAGMPAADLNFNGSELPDNIWNQTYDSSVPVNQLLNLGAEWQSQGNTWFEPTAVRVHAMLSEHIQNEDPEAGPPQFRVGTYPELEHIWDRLLEDNDILDLIAAKFEYRHNGNIDKLLHPAASDETIVLAARTVQHVRRIWTADAHDQRRIRFTKGLSPRERQRRLQERKARTFEAVRAAVQEAYQKSPKRPAGAFAASLQLASILFAYRWERPNNPQYRVPAHRRYLPKRAYQLLHYLPANEQEGYFQDDGFLPTSPSWITRIRIASNTAGPEIGRLYTVQRQGKSRWDLIPEEGGDPVAYLPTEGFGLAGMTSIYEGVLPRQHIVSALPDFAVTEPVAVFRQDIHQVRQQIERNYADAADRLRQAQAEI